MKISNRIDIARCRELLHGLGNRIGVLELTKSAHVYEKVLAEVKIAVRALDETLNAAVPVLAEGTGKQEKIVPLPADGVLEEDHH